MLYAKKAGADPFQGADSAVFFQVMFELRCVFLWRVHQPSPSVAVLTSTSSVVLILSSGRVISVLKE